MSEAKPFQKARVDFAWPLYIKKGKVSVKVYICLFTCVVSRGVHLELEESLSVSDFMLCFGRFSGRRGVPGMIVSDNVKTFLAANSLFEGYWLVKRLENILKATIFEW